MPKSVTEFNIFLASPSDLKDERDSINEVIDELNNTYGAYNSLAIKLLKWETNSAPAITLKNTQDIISNDIGNSYDIFIGILWKKFGTPTNRANSGTEEEFLLAYERFIKSPDEIQILIYFKNGFVDMDEIDLSQLSKVREFKKSMIEKNVLYWEFQTINDLHSYLRLHIPKRIDELLEKAKNKKTSINPIEKELINVNYEELGLIDFQEISIDSFSESESSMIRLTQATFEVGEKINKKTSEINKINKSKQQLSFKELRNHCQATANIFNIYSDEIEKEAPIFQENFDIAVKSVSQILLLSKEEEDFEESTKNYISVVNLFEKLDYATNSMIDFFNIVSTLPRIEKEFNKARNNLENKLTVLIDKMKMSLSITDELIKLFETKYGFKDSRN
jgi:hypothetical protein